MPLPVWENSKEWFYVLLSSSTINTALTPLKSETCSDLNRVCAMSGHLRSPCSDPAEISLSRAAVPFSRRSWIFRLITLAFSFHFPKVGVCFFSPENYYTMCLCERSAITRNFPFRASCGDFAGFYSDFKDNEKKPLWPNFKKEIKPTSNPHITVTNKDKQIFVV